MGRKRKICVEGDSECKTSESHPMSLTIIPFGEIKLSLSLAPGKIDYKWRRSIHEDINELVTCEVDVVVCLLEWREMENLQMVQYPQIVQESNIQFYHFPIKDMAVPSLEQAKSFCKMIMILLDRGNHVMIHCRSGLGRAGTIAACILVEYGLKSQQSINFIRRYRKGAILNKIQENFISEYSNSDN